MKAIRVKTYNSRTETGVRVGATHLADLGPGPVSLYKAVLNGQAVLVMAAGAAPILVDEDSREARELAAVMDGK